MNLLYNGISLIVLDNLKFLFDIYFNQDNVKDVLLILYVFFFKFIVLKSEKVVLKWEG